MSLPKTYKAWQVKEAGAPLQLQTVESKAPGKGEVLVKVLACGICHSDVGMQKGEFGPVHPRVPGHEIVGDIVAVGESVSRFTGGERVGGAWHGGHDGTCATCQLGQFQSCQNGPINGVTRDGGYAEYVTLRAEAVVRVPADLDPAETAPLLCAGVTVFNGIRKMEIPQGSLVAVQGLGGLGHLAVQYATKMGYRVAAISSGAAKAQFASELGAEYFIDSSVEDPVARLKALGGAALVVATAPNAKAISPLTGALRARGKLLVLAPVGNIEINSLHLIAGGCSVHGWPSGHAGDSEDAIEFSRKQGVKCLIEKFPLGEAPEAVERMMSNKVRFRSVLVMD
ncbi:alcohol dehydrogenase GroES-like domain-containing protein [Colletotrichum scovillei]|uniref:Alcohol dehydrogenase GroES-like domain-containing protein n=1 Tax=Colletotrichum scovillei TaxID=1209932 RepID=A0A9P7R6T8_9PEZI|nr:alcohol dehydrogenase GroES-like domain-containing protein [Colletotrichum scovillei]KAG7070288.1 alcohol dehydrogenase GroES-like domain-containing protein [Colletotrichum scovillei]KAG7078538.1 alcohol dehydrogenase GroES-like domain-containing protein [Colletotrichum scovillei]